MQHPSYYGWVFYFLTFFYMKLINTLARTYNGIKQGQTVDVEDKETIGDYLENGFEKAGKEQINGLASGNAQKEKALDKMNKTELIEKGATLGLTLDPVTSNPEMVVAIEAKQKEIASGNAQ